MSLDITLKRKRWITYDQLSFEEDSEIVYETNFTHNAGLCAGKAGIYTCIWRPYKLRSGDVEFENREEEYEFEERQIIKAEEIISYLEKGLELLKSDPTYYKTFDPSNGWGKYDDFVPFVEKYLEACKEFPESIIEVSR